MKIGKKEKSITASGLARVEMRPVRDNCVALLLTDTKEKTTGYLVTPEGVGVLLSPLLGLAAQWADVEDLSIDKSVGPRQALPASRVVLEKGRGATECALRVFVGKMELTFLIPLDAVINGLSAVIPMITQERGH